MAKTFSAITPKDLFDAPGPAPSGRYILIANESYDSHLTGKQLHAVSTDGEMFELGDWPLLLDANDFATAVAIGDNVIFVGTIDNLYKVAPSGEVLRTNPSIINSLGGFSYLQYWNGRLYGATWESISQPGVLMRLDPEDLSLVWRIEYDSREMYRFVVDSNGDLFVVPLHQDGQPVHKYSGEDGSEITEDGWPYTPTNVNPYGIWIDDDDNLYLCGFGPFGGGLDDVEKVDAQGNLLWRTDPAVSGNLSEVVATSDGVVVVSDSFTLTGLDADTGAQLWYLTALGRTAVEIALVYNGVPDDEGNTYWCAYREEAGGGANGWEIAKVSSTGEVVWEELYIPMEGNGGWDNFVYQIAIGWLGPDDFFEEAEGAGERSVEVEATATFEADQSITVLATDGEYVYSGSDTFGQTVRKHNPDLSVVWEDDAYSDGITSIQVDDDGNVYASDGNIVRKLDADGNLVWSHTAAGMIRGELIVFDGSVYYMDPATGTNGTIHNMRMTDATTVWSYGIGSADPTSPTALAVDGNSNVFIGTDDGRLRKVDSGGNLLWTENQASDVISILTDLDGNVYSGCQDGLDHTNANATITKRSSDGTLLWTFDDFGTNAACQVETLLFGPDGDLYAGGLQGSGEGVTKRITREGEEVWSADVRGYRITFDDEGALYVAARTSPYYTYRLDPDDGSTLWRYEGQNQLLYVADLAALGSVVYAGSRDNSIHRLASSGSYTPTDFFSGNAPTEGLT